MGIRLKVGVRGPPLRPLSKQASMQIADRVPLHRTHSPISPLPTGSRRDRPYVRVSSGGESVVSTRPLHHTGVSVCAGGGGGGGRGAGRDHGRWLRWVAGLGWGGPGAWLTTAAAGAAVVGRGPRPRRPTRGSWLAAWRVGRLALSGCRRRARRRPGAPGRPPRSGVADDRPSPPREPRNTRASRGSIQAARACTGVAMYTTPAPHDWGGNKSGSAPWFCL